MSLLIKICGLRNSDDVAAAVGAGADAIGFVFADSVRRVAPSEAKQAVTGAPAGIRRVAVMKNPSPAEWGLVLDEFLPDVLQTDADDYAALDVPRSVQRWPVFREGGDVPDDGQYLYEGMQSGSGQTVDWSKAAELAGRGEMILAGGLNAKNVAAAIAAVNPWGVDVSSGVESAPGIKDPQLIKEFVTAARAAETTQ